PTVREVREALAGNLCRCTGYTKIYDAVLAAGERIRGGATGIPVASRKPMSDADSAGSGNGRGGSGDAVSAQTPSQT
ncbi:MAG TPA: 2Fe-2S iron-sulfur cluster-binding protein, partial [Longimicrobiales bacterium]|nr:2Fe-2S iron-sulfur cluster-binding protein [Longimicrobiales bacterium]